MHPLMALAALLIAWARGPLVPGPPGACVACAWAVVLDRPGLDCATLHGAARAWDRAHGHGSPYGVYALSSVGDPLVYSHLLRGVTYTQNPAATLAYLRSSGPAVVLDTARGAPHAIACYGLTATGVLCADSGPWTGEITITRGEFTRLPGFWAALPLR